MKHRLLTSILIMTITIAGAGGVIVSAAEVPDTAAVSATEAETTEEIKEAEEKDHEKSIGNPGSDRWGGREFLCADAAAGVDPDRGNEH